MAVALSQSPTTQKLSIVPQSHTRDLKEGIRLNVHPGQYRSWEDYIRYTPANSIALDGHVPGVTRIHLDPFHLSLNHHDGADRLATRCTAAQTELYIKQGLMDRCRVNGRLQASIDIEDPDEDVSLSIWLLLNHERISGQRTEQAINWLIHLEDRLDTTAGAYPINPKDEIMEQLAWIFEDYREARTSGRLKRMNGSEMADVVERVCERIDLYTIGRGRRKTLDLNYEVIGGDKKNWSLIREVGSYSRTGFFHDGGEAYVSLISTANGFFHYSIGKMRLFGEFPLERIFASLNRAEGLSPGAPNCWGGGNMVGGSPRLTGSKLSPTEIEKIINSVINSSTSIKLSNEEFPALRGTKFH